MVSRERLLARATRRGERLAREVADAAREARLAHGLTLATVGSLLGVSRSKVWRWEQARGPHPDLVEAAQWCQVLELDLVVKTYPSSGRVHDLPQLKVLDRFRAQTPLISWQAEAGMPMYGDQRAWDLLGEVEGARVGVAGETRLRDTEALVRREKAKMRDSNVDRLILLLWATRANRETLREIRELIRPDLPLDTREVMSALRAGRDPGASGIVLI